MQTRKPKPKKEAATCLGQSWDLNPGTCAPPHTTACFSHRHSGPASLGGSWRQSVCLHPAQDSRASLGPRGVGLGGPKGGLVGGWDGPHLSSPPTGRNPRAPLCRGLAPLGTPRGPAATQLLGHLPTPLPPGPAPALTSGVGHDLGLLWMDSEREELERDSAFLAVLRGPPARVAGAGSEDFGVQRPGEPGGRSRSKEKMTCSLGVCGLRSDQGPRVVLDLGVRPSTAKFPYKKGNTGWGGTY